MKKFKKGFTLIELLIVIALLGTLAVALLAALDPLEQIKKGTDTGVRNTVAEIHSAMVRYASLQGGLMPFDGTLSFAAVGTVTGGTAYDAIQKVIDQGELKSDFLTLAKAQLNSIYITGINDPLTGTQIVNVCYAPTAKSFKSDVNTKFIQATGSVVEQTCANGTVVSGGAQCYWCVR